MAMKRIPLNLNDSQVKAIDKLGLKLGLDRTNTIRYCIARTLEAEGIKPVQGSR